MTKRKRIAESIGIVGATMIVVGCYLIHPAAAWITGGGAMLFVGVRLQMRGQG